MTNYKLFYLYHMTSMVDNDIYERLNLQKLINPKVQVLQNFTSIGSHTKFKETNNTKS
jgi:hypothetical protein